MDEPTSFDKLQFLREEIRFQQGLIGYRISWFVTSQSFLFSAFAIACSGSRFKELRFFWGILVPALGEALCVLVLVALLAALARIETHRQSIRKLPDAEFFPPESLTWSAMSEWYVKIAPVLFAVAWVVLFVVYWLVPVMSRLV